MSLARISRSHSHCKQSPVLGFLQNDQTFTAGFLKRKKKKKVDAAHAAGKKNHVEFMSFLAPFLKKVLE